MVIFQSRKTGLIKPICTSNILMIGETALGLFQAYAASFLVKLYQRKTGTIGPQNFVISGSAFKPPLREGRVVHISTRGAQCKRFNPRVGGSMPIVPNSFVRSGRVCLPTHSLPARSTSCSLVLTCFGFSVASSCAGEEALEEEVDLFSLVFCG